MEKIYAKLQDILEADNLSDNDILDNFEDWDSLSIITLITFLDKEYGVNLYTNEIKATKSVKDLMDLIKSKLK
ncbi:hypothetical protein BKH41_04345 [Helicobacter sp. 12S02232-10]|uniref:acyl carrier protein n=1 Tax=Helicobacter sp. 12S02232-10 TaxID=1476197 RepID=UPI000BA7BAFB|nr:acyl carrier protein [Helicobacter sp. 12S02232-10]PAF48865.1 hypothetical protein BKH41_04345 [Helicobacter sp. 12S02232-10]